MKVLAASQSLFDQPGTVAFLVIFGMGVMLFFVFRSMSKHLRKISMAARAEAEAAARAQAGTDPGAGTDIQAGTADLPARPASQPPAVSEQGQRGRRPPF